MSERFNALREARRRRELIRNELLRILTQGGGNSSHEPRPSGGFDGRSILRNIQLIQMQNMNRDFNSNDYDML
jgi:hypothetical protein